MKRMLLLLPMLLLLLAGCAEPFAALAADQPTPYDTAAAHVDLQIGMHLDDQRQVLVAYTFTIDGQPIRFTHGETVVCNGVYLAHNGPIVYAYSAFVPLPSPGQPIRCRYDSKGVFTWLTLPAPFPPQIDGIAPQQRITRASAWRLAWDAVKGAQVQVGADNGLGSAGVTLAPMTDDGHAMLATTALKEGAGTIYIIRTARLVIAHSGFHTCEVNTTASVVIPVVWV